MPAALDDRLLTLLHARPSWTGAALARELGVSLRTVRRALARLADDGVLLDAGPGPGGGVRLAGGASLGRLRLDHREALDLLMALAVAESLASPLLLRGVREGLQRKLGLALPQEQASGVGRVRRRILVGAPASASVRATRKPPHPEAVAAVQDAFFAQAPLAIDYVDQAGTRSQRTLEPHYLLLNQPVWYVLGLDRRRDAGGLLRLDRIEQARLVSGRFSLRPAAEWMADLTVSFDQV
jgi:predicted DNA-binding transcriptional regulator YafY